MNEHLSKDKAQLIEQLVALFNERDDHPCTVAWALAHFWREAVGRVRSVDCREEHIQLMSRLVGEVCALNPLPRRTH